MRHKMKTIKDKVGLRLRKDAWDKMETVLPLRTSPANITQNICYFGFTAVGKSGYLDSTGLEEAADLHLEIVEQGCVGRCWNLWKRASDMRNAERELLQRVKLRLMGNAIDIWRKHA